MVPIRWHNLLLVLFVFLRIGLRFTAHCLVAGSIIDPSVVFAMPLLRSGTAIVHVEPAAAIDPLVDIDASNDGDDSSRPWFQLIRKNVFLERISEWIPVLVHAIEWGPPHKIPLYAPSHPVPGSRIPDPLVHPPA